MRVEEQLSATISARVQDPRPVSDLPGAVLEGRRIRRRRNVAAVAALAAVSSVAAGVVMALPSVPDLVAPEPERFASAGRLDFTEGARAFASPDGGVWIGGRSFSTQKMGYLDTEATATPYGLVFFDKADQPHLLARDGSDVLLAPTPSEHNPRFHASAKADAQLPLVAFTQSTDDGVTVWLHGLDTGRSLDSFTVPCSGASCEDVRVDGVDRGLVFVRTEKGTFVWDPNASGAQRWTLLGKGGFRVADVRNGRVLWSGAPPAPASNNPVAEWEFTQGAIDAELSYDGGHVLYWSPILEPTEPSGRPLRLQVKKAQWFTFDTDGSVLAATSEGRGWRSRIYDCEIPSGSCEQIGRIPTRSGDPVFIGNDM